MIERPLPPAIVEDVRYVRATPEELESAREFSRALQKLMAESRAQESAMKAARVKAAWAATRVGKGVKS